MDATVQPLTVEDFKGGITDYYIGGRMDKYQKADNFIIYRHDTLGKLYTRPGSTFYSTAHPQIPAGAQRIGTFRYFEGLLFAQSAREFYYFTTSWQTLAGPSGNKVFPVGNTVNNVVSIGTWNKQMFVCSDNFTKPQKIYMTTGVPQLRTAGMPMLASDPVVTPTANTGKTYLYRFTYEYTYISSGLTFLDVGPVREVFVPNSDDPGTNQNNITAIPALSNGAVDNYDTASANLRVGIYRTFDGGINFFRVGSVANGTTTFNDTVSDATLIDNVQLYTEGGIVENDPPPLAKVVHCKEHLTYYANTSESDGLHPNRLYQAIPDDPDSVPATFFTDIDDEIVGVSSTQDVTVILGAKFTYRLDGTFDELGRGSLVTMKIGDTAGCVSSQSVVSTTDGIFWAGPDGFYYSDGFKVVRINRSWNNTYARLVDPTPATRRLRIQGKYDSLTHRIWWACWDGSGTDNNKFFILDLNWGISDDMPFTTASNGNYFAPSALEFINNQLIRGDRRGYVFQHSTLLYTDPRIDEAVSPSNWIQATIFYDYLSCATNFGTDMVRKFVSRISVASQNETNLSLQPISNNDDQRQVTNLMPVRYRGNIVWGDPDVYWGDPNLIWNRFGLISDFRRMPKANLRCLYKQIGFQPAFVAIVSSDLLGTCTVDPILHTATLDVSAFDWPSNSLDYVIAFENDAYANTYMITIRTSDVLTFADPHATAPTGVQQWVVRGYPKGEIFNMISYTLNWNYGGRTQDHFQRSDTGEVGSSS